ncbi:hypothetical protein JXI42_03380 [bacterium]|nr:hypothetical protein [bacterium]
MYRRILFLTILLILINISGVMSYTYWVPYVDTLHISSEMYWRSNLVFHALFDSTAITSSVLDTVLNAGEGYNIADYTSCGVSIETNKLTRIMYNAKIVTPSEYEPTEFYYTLQPEFLLGTEYLVGSLYEPPAAWEFVAVTGTRDRTNLIVNETETYILDAGECITLTFRSDHNVMSLIADQKIAVAHISHRGSGHDDFTAYTPLPLELWGTEFFSPLAHALWAAGYEDGVDSTGLIIVALENMTTVQVSGTPYSLDEGERMRVFIGTDSASIVSDRPIQVVKNFMMYANDRWRDVIRIYSNTVCLHPSDLQMRYAFMDRLSPSDMEEHGGPRNWWTITSFDNGNRVTADVNFDGSLDLDVTLDRFETLYLTDTSTIIGGWDTASAILESENPVQVINSVRGWWWDYIEAHYEYSNWDVESLCDLDVSIMVSDDMVCSDDTIALIPIVTGGTPPYTYFWGPHEYLGDEHAENPVGYNHSLYVWIWYFVRVTDSLGCIAEDSILVGYSHLSADAGPNFEICPHHEIALGGYYGSALNGIPPHRYTWTNDVDPGWVSHEGHPIVSPDVTTVYYLEVKDSAGCYAYDTVEIINDFVAVGDFGPISPDSGAVLPPGDITIEWEEAPGTAPIYYTLYIDGLIVAALIESTHFTMNYPCGETHYWYVEALNFCGDYSIWSDRFCCGEYDTCWTSMEYCVGEWIIGSPGSIWGAIDECCPEHPPLYPGTLSIGWDPPFSTFPCEVRAWFGDTIAYPGDTILLPVYVEDPSHLGATSFNLHFAFFPDVFEVIGTESMGTASEDWGSLSFSVSSPGNAEISGSGITTLDRDTILCYIIIHVFPSAAQGGYTPMKLIELTFNDGSIHSITENGIFLVNWLPISWMSEITVKGNNSNTELVLSFGASPFASENYDPGLDIIALPPVGTIHAYFPLGDTLNPHIAELSRDIRGNLDFPTCWLIHTEGEAGTLFWNPEYLPSGTFLLSGVLDMHNIDLYAFEENEDVEICFERMTPGIGEVNLISGWNLISFSMVPTFANIERVLPTVVSAPYWYHPLERTYVFVDGFQAGKGYWVYSDRDTTYRIGGIPVDEFSAVLSRGWNLIGSATTTMNVTFETGRIIPPLYYWGGVSYEASDTIASNLGYWVLVAAPECTLDASVASAEAHFYKEIGYLNADNIQALYGSNPPPPPGSSFPNYKPLLPDYFTLETAPNPFNSRLEVTYKVPYNSKLDIEIYNIYGEKIITLVERYHPKGVYRTYWDGCDITDEKVSSGIYFVGMRTDEYLVKRKVLLLK